MSQTLTKIEPQPVKPRIKREELEPDGNLCEHCTAKCCRYFALQVDTPETWEDFDHFRWYLTHGSVSIFVEDEIWYLMVHMDCKYLQDDYRCGIYEDRPAICRSYTTDNCEYDGDTCYEKIFESPEQLWEYAEALFPPRPQRSSTEDGANPILALPVIPASP